jgi:hypothetical protein
MESSFCQSDPDSSPRRQTFPRAVSVSVSLSLSLRASLSPTWLLGLASSSLRAFRNAAASNARHCRLGTHKTKTKTKKTKPKIYLIILVFFVFFFDDLPECASP